MQAVRALRRVSAIKVNKPVLFVLKMTDFREAHKKDSRAAHDQPGLISISLLPHAIWRNRTCAGQQTMCRKLTY
jgi:hypothetical protein